MPALLLWIAISPAFAALFPADLSGVRPGPVTTSASPDSIRVEWSDETNRPCVAEFSLDDAKPLITSISIASTPITAGARPFYWVETGKRRRGWDEFFDFPPSHPEGTRRFQSVFQPRKAVARTRGNRLEILFEGLKLGIFDGAVAYTFFPGSRLIQQEAVVSTTEPDTAFYYDAGFQWTAEADRRVGGNMSSRIAYFDTEGRFQQTALSEFASERKPFDVRYRAISARTSGGAVTVFPPPHQYFIPRDFTSNMGFVWARSFRGQVGLGIRQLPDENWIYYPWANAPPGSQQRLSLFLLVSTSPERESLNDALRFTNSDRFAPLPGYKTLASHWHLAYTVQAMEHGFNWTPPFKPVLKDMGVDIAMIMDFHGDGHPRDLGQTRLKELAAFYNACRAQSDSSFLLIPGEEANAHYGGHWTVSFPKQVLWHMDRKDGMAPLSTHPTYGKVYATANSAELLDLMRKENGFVYQTHPRTKGSRDFPDKVRDADFFRDATYFGAGWKAMPVDYSTRRQGIRSLNLLDDMANWGQRKGLIGEVDVFQLDHTHELYGHMNINYVRLPSLPSFDNYGDAVRALARSDFFVTTGEVLLPEVSIRPAAGDAWEVRASAKWTFPLAYAVIAWGDGVSARREIMPLDSEPAFGNSQLKWEVRAPGARWMRLELWDVAGNGAFVNPTWK